MNSKHKVLWPLAFLVGGLFVTSCYYDDYQTLYGTGGACDTAAVSYSTDIQPLIATQCGGCHGNTAPSAGLSLTNHTQLAAAINTGNLLARVHLPAGAPGAMPTTGPLSSCQKAKLRTWKRQGALNN
jgi:hypothetical protein